MSKAPRKTRLKGTETMKPCFDCGVTKNRFTAFKPRWAGCSLHRTERGRRYLEPGCADCSALVNGNIRQPRCIECDRQRPKKRKAKKAAAVTATKPEAPKIEPEAPKIEPKPVATVTTPEPKAEPKADATPVTVPEPPKPKAQGKSPRNKKKKERPGLATMADLSKLFE